MKKFFLLLIVMMLVVPVRSQLVRWSPEDIKLLTQDWTGERTPDGRPMVSLDLLDRLKSASMEEVWAFLRGKGYTEQFENFASLYENGWVIIHPDQVMTGRVVTAQFMPARPDLNAYVQEIAKRTNMYTPHTNYAPIYELREGDVYVADSYGKMVNGTLIGDNLGNAIWRGGKRGIIYNGSIRDLEGLSEIEGFNGWIRGSDPSAIGQMTCTTVNAPIRIGRVTVLPGYVVLAKFTGVIFIPSHLVQECVLSSELTNASDQFNFFCMQTNKFPYENERFVVDQAVFQAAFLEWFNARTDISAERKKELLDYREERARERAAQQQQAR